MHMLCPGMVLMQADIAVRACDRFYFVYYLFCGCMHGLVWMRKLCKQTITTPVNQGQLPRAAGQDLDPSVGKPSSQRAVCAASASHYLLVSAGRPLTRGDPVTLQRASLTCLVTHDNSVG